MLCSSNTTNMKLLTNCFQSSDQVVPLSIDLWLGDLKAQVGGEEQVRDRGGGTGTPILSLNHAIILPHQTSFNPIHSLLTHSCHTHTPQPLLCSSTLTASGWLIRSRQLSAPPLTRPLLLAVGRYHAAYVQQEVKGSRYGI